MRRTKAAAAQIRGALIDAALWVFCQWGCNATTRGALCEHVGGPAGLYAALMRGRQGPGAAILICGITRTAP